MPSTPITPLDPRVEMFERGTPDPFFNMKALAPRPLSAATEMFDTEFEDDMSDLEEDDSPRHSLNSAGRRSETTLSSLDELPTPKSNNYHGFNFDLQPKSVEGPKGPHLFRISQDSSPEEEYHLSMSPLTPRFPRTSRAETVVRTPTMPDMIPEAVHRPISSLTDVVTRLNEREVAQWSPRQVARWMYHAGFEPAIVAKFEENEVSGAVLITLKYEDLRELEIKSFSIRHKLWDEIHTLRGDVAALTPSPTEIECVSEEDPAPRPKKKHSKRRHRRAIYEDAISPLDSVSIVGIEQLMPRPHKCAKGENCSKWKKQQRIIQAFKDGHPINPNGGSIMVAGDPGNPLTAEAVRPFSDIEPSVVASSDVLGPDALPPFQHLEEATLAAANIQSRDPQDNVKQFLNFQHLNNNINSPWPTEEPSTPPYEMFPPLQPPTSLHPHHNLQSLPKLAIPNMRPPMRSASADAFSPYPMDRAEPLSPELRSQNQSPTGLYRFGTPSSEMDIPVTYVNQGPIARNVSQSVPPNMSYRGTPTSAAPPLSRSHSRSSRRPSFSLRLARLDEDSAISTENAIMHTFNSTFSPIERPIERASDDVNHAGWMKKRKTRMLRHEWHDHHFTLRGTRLAMHKDERALETLEAIDIDDYAIACSSLASSKLNAAFKAMNIKLGNGKEKGLDSTAFSFQLIPAAIEKGQKLKKRESSISGANGAGKTHHFAVRSRDERIDWMRELMLAKALKQKGAGFEINVNGNMI